MFIYSQPNEKKIYEFISNFRFIKYSVLSTKFYLSNIYPIHHVVLNIQIDTILEYIIKFKVKQIMSKDDFIQEMIYKYVIRGSLNQ